MLGPCPRLLCTTDRQRRYAQWRMSVKVLVGISASGSVQCKVIGRTAHLPACLCNPSACAIAHSVTLSICMIANKPALMQGQVDVCPCMHHVATYHTAICMPGAWVAKVCGEVRQHGICDLQHTHEVGQERDAWRLYKQMDRCGCMQTV